jgi:hypothetical protein
VESLRNGLGISIEVSVILGLGLGLAVFGLTIVSKFASIVLFAIPHTIMLNYI